MSQSEILTRGEVYVAKLKSAMDNFSKDLNGQFLKDADKRVKNFFKALEDEIISALSGDTAIRSARDDANALASEIDYGQEENKGHATENKEKAAGLRDDPARGRQEGGGKRRRGAFPQ